MCKRISVRGIIIDDNKVYIIFRRRVNKDKSFSDYYVIPGGGLEKEESLDETDNSIAHFFKCKIVNGIPILGGEELERCSKENYYEIRKVNIWNLNIRKRSDN